MDFFWGTVLMIGVSVAMFVTNWRLALAVLAVVPVLFGVSLYFRQKILRTSRIVRKTNSRITAAYNEGIVGVKTSKVFVREAENLRDFDSLIDEMRGYSVHNAVLSAVYLPIILSLGSVAIAMALAIGGHQVIAGGLNVGEVVTFLDVCAVVFRAGAGYVGVVCGAADGACFGGAGAEPGGGGAGDSRQSRGGGAASRGRQRWVPGSDRADRV